MMPQQPRSDTPDAPHATPMSLKARASRGFFWLVVDVAGGQASALFIFLVLARLVTPEDYGVFALASSIMAFAYLVCHGVSAALVQCEEVNEDHLSAALWLS